MLDFHMDAHPPHCIWLHICIYVTTWHYACTLLGCERFHLKIRPKKCYFIQSHVVFLGHILSAHGILLKPEKVDKVKN